MNIGIVGVGSIGTRHLNIIEKMYGTKVNIYLYRTSTAKGNLEEYENIYDIDEFFEKGLDTVFICNPTSRHIEFATIAAKNKCNLFMEKPLSNTLQGCNDLLKIIKDNNLITLMGCNMRFNPIILKLKKYVDENKYGTALSFSVTCGSYLPQWRPNQDYTISYSASKELGGGVVLDLIHEIDYCRWIFGDFKGVQSSIGKISNLHIETEDYADIIVLTDKNIRGSIHLDYYRISSERKIEIIFENYIIIGDLIQNSITIISRNDEKVETFQFERNYMYEEQIKYFFNCVNNNVKTFNDIEEGYNVLKLCLDIKNKSNV